MERFSVAPNEVQFVLLEPGDECGSDFIERLISPFCFHTLNPSSAFVDLS